MAINLIPGNNIVVYTGTSDMPLSSLSNYNSTYISKVYAVSANGLGYTSGTPGSNFGVTTLKAPVGDVPTYYIFVVKQATTLSSTLFGLGTTLVIRIPAGQAPGTATVPVDATIAGTYALVNSTGLTALSYTKAGNAFAFPGALASGDTLLVTGTTQAGTDGILTLVKQ